MTNLKTNSLNKITTFIFVFTNLFLTNALSEESHIIKIIEKEWNHTQTLNGKFHQKIDGNKISEVYEVRGVDAKQIFSKLNYAIALIYQDAADVIKFKDDQSKLLVIKALALVPVLDAYKLMNPNNSALTDYIDYSHNYTLIIEARDEKYRIQMIYQDGKYSDSQLTEYKLPFSSKMDYDMSELEGIMDKAREEMNQDYYDMTVSYTHLTLPTILLV